MGSKTLRSSLCLLRLEAPGHITLTSGARDLIARGAAWTAPGGHTHQREGSKVMLVCFMCDSGGAGQRNQVFAV